MTTSSVSEEKSPEGRSIILASWLGTAAFTVTAVGADLVAGLRVLALTVAATLFLAGCAVFIVAYLRAIGRSRTDAISVIGLFFLSGSAPRSVRRNLLGSLAVQIVVAIVTASIRPYTSLAAGTLVPVYGLGLCGLWASRYGTFEPR